MTLPANGRTLLRSIAALVALGTPLAAVGAQVEGRVVDADGAGVSLTVSLDVHDGEQIVYQQQAVTDESGVARWPDAPATEGLSARIRATYDGAVYMSPVAALESGAAVIELTVLPVAREGRPLHLDTLHLIVQADEPGFLRVLQFMTISNAGQAAFAGGPQLADGRAAGIVIPLPTAARNVSPAPFPNEESALDPEQAQFGSDRILDARPVPADGRQVAVTYELPLTAGATDVSLLLPYPTASVSLLLGGTGAPELRLTSDRLRSEQAEMIGDQEYDLWVAEALQPGTELSFTIAPARVALTTAQLGMIVAAAGLLMAVAGSLFGGGSIEYHDAQRRAVIATVAALDDSHEAGEVAEGDYFYRRGRELDRLALLAVGKGASERASD